MLGADCEGEEGREGGRVGFRGVGGRGYGVRKYQGEEVSASLGVVEFVGDWDRIWMSGSGRGGM